MHAKGYNSALVVDDSAFMRGVLRDILASSGFSTIYEAQDGIEAVKIFSKHRPDLVTMDIIMPGPDGLQTTQELLKIDSNAKIVIATSVGQEQTMQEALKIGAKGFLVKPFQASAVKELLRQVLDTP